MTHVYTYSYDYWLFDFIVTLLAFTFMFAKSSQLSCV